MKTLTLKEVAEELGSEYSGDGICKDITSDSRSVSEGSLFVAIKGDNFDGHRFVDAAFESGAAAVVISDPSCVTKGKTCFLVKDTKQAYIQLGGLYRKKFAVRCVAVSGSVGKTTTKDFIACALSVFGKTHKTQGNQNNEIGFPNTLFALEDDTKMLVCEMGMSGFGEIAPMSIAAAPEIAVLTNIGVSHLEMMGTRENILKEKLDIVKGLCPPKILVLNDDNDLLSGVREIPGVKIVRVGIDSERADFRAELICSDNFATSFVIRTKDQAYMAKIPTLGDYNVLNALIATAVADSMGYDTAAAVRGLADYSPSGMRQRVVPCEKITVIEDCYNASPDSMRASIGTLCKHFSGRKIAVLADMLELGTDSADMHEKIGEFAAQSGVNMLVLYGDNSLHMAGGAKKCGMKDVFHFDSRDELLSFLLGCLKEGDTVLFKGSHSMQLEKVVAKLYETYVPKA